MSAAVMLLAWGLAAGAPPSRLMLAGAVVFFPWLALPFVAVAVIAGRRRPVRPVLAVDVAAQLRSGHTLRRAVAIAAGGAGLARVRRLAIAGMPMEAVAEALADESGGSPLLAAAVRMADRSGGRSAAVFDALGLAALDAEALRREQRAAAAPALLAASIVGGLPLAYVGFLAATGRLGDVLGGGGPVAAFGASGLLLVLLGVAVVAVQARRIRG